MLLAIGDKYEAELAADRAAGRAPTADGLRPHPLLRSSARCCWPRRSLVVLVRNPVHAALFLVLALLHGRRRSGCSLYAEFLAITLVLVYVGAVMVLFLFVVMMLDINLDQLREGFWSNLPLAGAGGRADGGRDGGAPLARRARRAASPRRPPAGYSNTKALGRGALHRLRVPLRARRGDPAGGDRRRHRAHAAQPQGDQVPGSADASSPCARRPAAHREDGVDETSATPDGDRRQ